MMMAAVVNGGMLHDGKLDENNESLLVGDMLIWYEPEPPSRILVPLLMNFRGTGEAVLWAQILAQNATGSCLETNKTHPRVKQYY